MELLWMLVAVGVFGVMAEEENSFQDEEEEKGKCWIWNAGWDVCAEDFICTVEALDKVWDNGNVTVVLSLEESKYPKVLFNLTLHNAEGEEEFLAKEEITLEVDDLRVVSLMSITNFTWNTAHLTVKVSPLGHPEITTEKRMLLSRATSDLQVFIQAEKMKPNSDEVFYRVIVADENPDDPKLLHIRVWNQDGSVNKTLVKVPESGIFNGSVLGKFGFNYLEALVSSSVTSETAISRAIRFESGINQFPTPDWLSVELQMESDLYFSKPQVKGSVILKSLEGVPLEGHCEVTLQPDSMTISSKPTRFRRKFSSRNMTLEGEAPTGEFEFNVVKDLRPVKKSVNEMTELVIQVDCTHRLSGSKVTYQQRLFLRKNLFDVELYVDGPPEFIPKGNSSHPQTTVALKFLVERRDGVSVKENDPSNGLQIKLIFSNDTSRTGQPSATNFSLPIPENGVVKLEFGINDLLQFSTLEKVQLSVGDVVKVVNLEVIEELLRPSLHASLLHPLRSIRSGDVVEFRLRSCRPYKHINVILTSSKKYYSSHRFSFASKNESGRLDEVIDIMVPFNVTEGSLNLIVYGVNNHQIPRSKTTLSSTSVKMNVILSSGPQEIKIVDQIDDDDLRTTVTFRLEGLPKYSIVSLQGVTRKPLSEQAKARRWRNRRLHLCDIEDRSKKFPEIRDDSPGDFDVSQEVHLKSNVEFNSNYYTTDGKDYGRIFFLDADKKTSEEDNGTLEVTTTLDRLTEFGTLIVSGATFNVKSGRTPMSNSPMLRINPPPVTLSLSVPPSIIVGETFEVLGFVENNLDATYVGHVTLEWSEEGPPEVAKELVMVKPNVFKILKFLVTPKQVGDVEVSLKSNISSRLTAVKKVKVFPPGVIYTSTKYILVNDRMNFIHEYFNISGSTFELPPKCSSFGKTNWLAYENDLLGDVFAFTQDELFKSTTALGGGIVLRLHILSSLYDFYESKKSDNVLGMIRSRAWGFNDSDDNYDSSIVEIASKLVLGTSKMETIGEIRRNVRKRWTQLTSMQMVDGSFQFSPSERTSSSNTTSRVENEGRQLTSGCVNRKTLLDTAFALLSLQKVNGSEIQEEREEKVTYIFPAADFERGIEYIMRVTAECQIEDTFAQSVFAFFFSQIDNRDALPFVQKMESTAKKDSEGTFWVTREGSPVGSIQATSLALMTYVNLKKLEEASEVARWLVSKKNADGCYGTLVDTAAAVESLSKYATFLASTQSNWPSLVKFTQNCVTPRRKVSTEDEFSVQASLEIDAGELSLEICPKKDNVDHLMVVEVVLPSGYFRQGDASRNGSFRFTSTPNKCSNIVANRMMKVFGGIPHSPTGLVTYYDFQNPLVRNEISFGATSLK